MQIIINLNLSLRETQQENSFSEYLIVNVTAVLGACLTRPLGFSFFLCHIV